MKVELTINATYEIPDTARAEYAASGECIGFILNPDTDGAELVKPGITWETSDREIGESFDLTFGELEMRGIEETDFERVFTDSLNRSL